MFRGLSLIRIVPAGRMLQCDMIFARTFSRLTKYGGVADLRFIVVNNEMLLRSTRAPAHAL